MERKLVFFTPKEGAKFDMHVAKQPIHQDIGNTYDKACGLIVEFLYPLYLAHRMVDSNHNQLEQTLKEILIKLEQETKKSPALIDPYENIIEMMVELTKCVLSTLTAVSLFLVKVTSLTENQFGKNSEEYSKIESLRKTLHKDSLSYKFCYELRNYSQHYGIPISRLAININKNQKPSLVATIMKSRLTAGSYKWKGFGASALNELDENFDLIPHLANYVDITNQLFRFMFSVCKSELINFNDIVINILEDAGYHGNKRFIFGCDMQDDFPDFDIEEIPYTFVLKLEKYILKLEDLAS